MDNRLQIQLEILKLRGEKPNFSKLGREYGSDRRTLKKAEGTVEKWKGTVGEKWKGTIWKRGEGVISERGTSEAYIL